MANKEQRAVLVLDDERSLELAHGRTLSIVTEGGDDLVEIRGEGGLVELRLRMTEGGPVLQVEGVKVALAAAESVEVQCKTFKVAASEEIALSTEGELAVSAEGEMKLEATEDVRVVGKRIHLN